MTFNKEKQASNLQNHVRPFAPKDFLESMRVTPELVDTYPRPVDHSRPNGWFSTKLGRWIYPDE